MAGADEAAATSALSFLDGDNGRLYYRGYDAVELARLASFEEAAFLLWRGELPNPTALRELRRDLAEARVLPSATHALAAALPAGLKPSAAIRALLSADDAERGAEPDELAQAIALTGRLGALVALGHRRRLGLTEITARDDRGHAADLLAMTLGVEPETRQVRALETALVLHLDLAFNASTHASRVAASTGAGVGAAVVAALATLEGPLHGGASAVVVATLERIGEPARAADFVAQALARKERVPGFGHRHFAGIDPRAAALKDVSRDLADGSGDRRLHDIAAALEAAMGDARGLRPNIDLYAATVFHALGLPPEIYVLLFAAARIVGWTAHAIEQRGVGRVIWPACAYTGPAPRPFIPIDRS